VVIFILKHFPFNGPPTANPNNIPDFRNVVLYELSFLLVGILDFGIEKWTLLALIDNVNKECTKQL
jgi:hypothetical protein